MKPRPFCLLSGWWVALALLGGSLLSSDAAVIQGTLSSKSGADLSAGQFVIQLRKLNPETNVFLFQDTATADAGTGYRYEFSNLEPGSYLLTLQDLAGVFALQYYGGGSFYDSAKVLKISGKSSLGRADFSLSPGRTLGGRVVDIQSRPVAGIDISVLALEGRERRYITGLPTDENGEWRIGLPAGSYLVLFKDLRDDANAIAAQWYAGSVSEDSAQPVDLLGGTNSRLNINGILERGRQVRGVVSDPAGNPMKGVYVTALWRNPVSGGFEIALTTLTGQNQTEDGRRGDFSLVLPNGEYVLYFEEESDKYRSQYWKNASSLNSATILRIDQGDVTGLQVQMAFKQAAKPLTPFMFVGNFEKGLLYGQVSITAAWSGAFSGSVLTPSGRTAFRGRFDSDGKARIPLGNGEDGLELSFQDSVEQGEPLFFDGMIRIGSGEAPLELRPTPRKGGREAPMVGKTINTLLESRKDSEKGFGFGFAGVRPGKYGVFRFAGGLADGTKLTGATRAVEDGDGGWKLPVAIPLASVKGFLHGEAAVDSSPAADDFHLASETPWTWTRSANPRAKAFQQGFEEKLTVRGREWRWTKGTSALGGTSANFTLTLSFGDNGGGFVPASGLERMSGILGTNNKPVWAETPPRGVAMTITPATGLVRGRIPGALNGKAVTISYQGMVFSSDMPLKSGGSARGAGFVMGPGGVVGDIRILAP